MKKILSILLFATLFISVLTGCKQDNTANVVANNLNDNLNKLSVAVNKLDTIDNKYLSNPDIYSSFQTSNNDQINNQFALASNEIETTQISNESVKQDLIDKITDKLLSQNIECNNQQMYTCDKYCDNNGNCYYTDCNGNNYCYNSNGNCSTCDEIPDTCQYMGLTNISSLNFQNQNDDNLNIETISNVESINENDTGSVDTNNITNEEELNNNESSDSINTPNPNVRMFYFSQESFAPFRLKYNPRYINQYNEATINDQIENYLYKIQKLYAMSEDSIEANNILQNCKQNIIECINEIKELNACIINGDCEPSIQELQALNNYIIDIKTTTKRLKDCNGELSNEINKIAETNSNMMINSVDVMNSNYMRLLNHIDTRVTYHKSAIATLEQIRYLLDNAINNGEISDEEIEQIIESFTTDNNIITDDSIIEENVQNGIVENDNVNALADDSDNNSTIENDEYKDDETILDYEIIPTQPEENIINDESTLEETETTTPTIDNTVTSTEEHNSNIDTYKEANSWSNIDTYKNIDSNSENTNLENNGIIEENSTNIDSIDSNLNNSDNTITDEKINDSDTITDSTIDENIDNNINDSTINNETQSNYNTSNNYTNSVITQNNLNNDDGYGGYFYTNDGEIKNNGINNDNEIGNDGNTLENNINKENNVNTYGYNTLLDIINQGTVNNGINTL